MGSHSLFFLLYIPFLFWGFGSLPRLVRKNFHSCLVLACFLANRNKLSDCSVNYLLPLLLIIRLVYSNIKHHNMKRNFCLVQLRKKIKTFAKMTIGLYSPSYAIGMTQASQVSPSSVINHIMHVLQSRLVYHIMLYKPSTSTASHARPCLQPLQSSQCCVS